MDDQGPNCWLSFSLRKKDWSEEKSFSQMFFENWSKFYSIYVHANICQFTCMQIFFNLRARKYLSIYVRANIFQFTCMQLFFNLRASKYFLIYVHAHICQFTCIQIFTQSARKPRVVVILSPSNNYIPTSKTANFITAASKQLQLDSID